MLSRLRGAVKPLILRAGRALGLLGLKPDYLTYSALALSVAVPALTYAGLIVHALIAVVVTSILDVLDGAVARAMGSTSLRGAFLDSFTDRVADASFFIGLALAGANTLASLTALTTSYLISYSRARGESLGFRLEGVGLMERGERLLAIIAAYALLAAGAVSAVNAVLAALTILNTVTIIQRVGYVLRGVRKYGV